MISSIETAPGKILLEAATLAEVAELTLYVVTENGNLATHTIPARTPYGTWVVHVNILKGKIV